MSKRNITWKTRFICGILCLLMLPITTLAETIMLMSASIAVAVPPSYAVTFYEMNARGQYVPYQEEGFESVQSVTNGQAPEFPTQTPNKYPGFVFVDWSVAPGTQIFGVTEIYARYEPILPASVLIEYVMENGAVAAQRYIAELLPGEAFTQTFDAPVVYGYHPVEKEAVQGFAVAPKAGGDGYEISIQIDQPSGDYRYVLEYRENTDSAYKVEHYQQNADGNGYTLVEEETLHGPTDSLVTAVPKTYEGFSCVTDIGEIVDRIAADQDTVVRLDYDRNEYTIAYELGAGGIFPVTQPGGVAVRYGAAIVEPEEPTRDGYTFDGWVYSDGQTYDEMPAHDLLAIAQWTTTMVPYTVHIWIGNADPEPDGSYGYYFWTSSTEYAEGDPYLAEVGSVFTIDESTMVDYDTFIEWGLPNYELTKYDEGIEIAGDGSTIINVYYDPLEITQRYYFLDGTLCPEEEEDGSAHTVHVQSCFKEVYSITGRRGYNVSHLFRPGGGFPAAYLGLNWYRNMAFTGTFNSVLLTLPYESGETKNLYARVIDVPYQYSSQYLGQYFDENGVLVTDTDDYELIYFSSFKSQHADVFLSLPKKFRDGYTMVKPVYEDLPDSPSIEEYKKIQYPTGQVDAVSEIFIYYNLLEFNVEFFSLGKLDSKVPRLYTQELASIDYEPDKPSGYEDYTFGGWFDNNNFVGDPVDMDTMVMPKYDVALYALWIPPVYDVTFENEGSGGNSVQQVNKGDNATEPDPGTRVGYAFGGWYWKSNPNQRFLFSQSIHADTTVIAKWLPRTDIPYKINHVHYLTGVNLHAPVTGTGEMNASFTAYAVELDGYVPDYVSKAVAMANIDANEVTFYYRPFTALDYTVYYKYTDTDGVEKDIAPPVTVTETQSNVVVVQRVLVPGYVADAYQKSLQLQSEGVNEVTFYYTKDTAETTYTVTIFRELLTPGSDGEMYAAETSAPITATVGELISVIPDEIDGYEYYPDISITSGTALVGGTLNLRLYYRLPRLTYAVEYRDIDTGEEVVLAQTRAGNKKGSQVSEVAQSFDGYRYESYKVNDGAAQTGETAAATINDANLVIVFQYKKLFALTATVTGGTIVPEGATSVARGDDQLVTFAPADNAALQSVTVDGEAVYDRMAGIGAEISEYQFTAIGEDHEIHVSYVAKTPISVRPKDTSATYNGQDQTVSTEIALASGTLPEGYRIEAVTSGTGQKVGNYDIEATNIQIFDDENRNVTALYDITPVAGTFTIDKASITIQTGSTSANYDGTAKSVTTYTLSEGTMPAWHSIIATVNTTETQPGTYPVSITLTDIRDTQKNESVLDQYDIHYDLGTLTIGAATVTVTPQGAMMYGESEPEYSYTLSGFVDGDEAAIASWIETMGYQYQSDASPLTNVGDTAPTVTMTGGPTTTEDGRYELAYQAGEITIMPRPVRVIAGSATKAYDGVALAEESYAQDEALDTLNHAMVNGDQLVCATSGSQMEVGTSANTLPASSQYIMRGLEDVSGNYTLTLVNGTLEVTRRTITITASDKIRYYGEANEPFFFTVAGHLPGHESTIREELGDLGGVQFVCAAPSDAPIGSTYPITPSGPIEVDNYTIEYKSGTLEVVPADRTEPVVRNYEGVYDGNPHGITVLGTSPQDTVQYSLTEGSGWVDDPILLTNATDGPQTVYVRVYNTVNGEYFTSATINITKRPMAVTIDDHTKRRGEPDPDPYTYTIEADTGLGGTGQISGDSFIINGVVFERHADDVDKNGVGEVIRIVGRDTMPQHNANYDITFVPGTLTILPEDGILIVVTADSEGYIYDGDEHWLGDDSYTVTGLPDGYTIEVTTTGARRTDVGVTENRVNTGHTVLSAGVDVTQLVTVQVIHGALTITPRELVIHGAHDSLHIGDPVPARGDYVITTTGLIGDETVDLDKLTVTTVYRQGDPIGQYDILCEDMHYGNYYVTAGKIGELSVVPRNIDPTDPDTLIEVHDYDEIYDGLPHSVSVSVSLTNTTLGYKVEYSLDGDTWTMNPAEAGHTDVVQNAPVLVRVTVDNYEPVTLTTGTVTIRPRPISVKPTDKSKAYDGLSLTADAVEIVDGELVNDHTLDWSTAVFTGELVNVGTINSNVFGVFITGGGSNYTIAYETGVLEITRRPATMTADEKTKLQGTTDPTLTFTPDGFLTEADQPAVRLVREAGETIGEYVIYITPTGGDSVNYDITFVNGTLTITTADALTVTITAASAEYAYDGTAKTIAAGLYDVSSLPEGYTVVALSSGATRTYAGETENVIEAYQVLYLGMDITKDVTVRTEKGKLTVTAAMITITPDDLTMVRGGEEPTLTAVVKGMPLNEQEVAYTLVREAGTDVGAYTISVQELEPALALKYPNYAFTLETGRLSILGQTVYHANLPEGAQPEPYTDPANYPLEQRATLVAIGQTGFTMTGYSFAGWSRTATGGTLMQPGTMLPMEKEGLTLYAQWTKIAAPTPEPTATAQPTATPSPVPTTRPTASPTIPAATATATVRPTTTARPTTAPTARPTTQPTARPTATTAPTAAPTAPTATAAPTATTAPTAAPTATGAPTAGPTVTPAPMVEEPEVELYTLTVYHYLQGTDTSIATPTSLRLAPGENYNVAPISSKLYEPVSGGVSGTMPGGNHAEVIYYQYANQVETPESYDPINPPPSVQDARDRTSSSLFTIMEDDIPLAGVAARNVGDCAK